MEQGYKTVYRGGSGEITEKKSRFIATVEPAASEEAAAAFIAGIKKKYWDARHNCSAFIIGRNGNLTRCSDDGEPAGTAGKPMLEALLGQRLTDCAVVVTRYFGGTLLGTGGLVRAYTQAVQEGLKNCVVIEKRPGYKMEIAADYGDVGRLQYLFSQEGIQVTASEYTDRALFSVVVPAELKENFQKKVTEATSGRCLAVPGELSFYALMDGKVLLFEG